MFNKNADSIRESMNKMRVERVRNNNIVQQDITMPDGRRIMTITHHNESVDILDFAINGRGDFGEAAELLHAIAAPKPPTALSYLRRDGSIGHQVEDVVPVFGTRILKP